MSNSFKNTRPRRTNELSADELAQIAQADPGDKKRIETKQPEAVRRTPTHNDAMHGAGPQRTSHHSATDQKDKPFTVRFGTDLHEDLRVLAAELQMSQNQVMKKVARLMLKDLRRQLDEDGVASVFTRLRDAG